MLVEIYKGYDITSRVSEWSGRTSYRASNDRFYFEAYFDTLEQVKRAIDESKE